MIYLRATVKFTVINGNDIIYKSLRDKPVTEAVVQRYSTE